MSNIKSKAVSVIIPTFNRPESLKRCIKSIFKEGLQKAEIIIVDSGDCNNSAEFSTGNFVKIFHYAGSLSECRDFGWRKAKGEIVVYLDDDTEVRKGWLRGILEPFKDPKTGGVSGPCIVSEKEKNNRDVFLMNKGLIGWFYKKVILEGRQNEVGKITKSGWWTPGADGSISNFQFFPQTAGSRSGGTISNVDYLEACNMALRKDLIKKAGGFDLGFKGTSEWSEVDLAMRVRKLGYKLVFNPRASLYHHVSKEGVFRARVNAKDRMENFIRYYLKHREVNIHFIATIIFLNVYWIYKALTTGNISWAGGVLGNAKLFRK